MSNIDKADKFDNVSTGIDSPARNAFSVTPHDTNDLPNVTRGIYVGVTGDLKVKTEGLDVVTFTNLAAGMIHPIMCQMVFATGTTATGIVGVW